MRNESPQGYSKPMKPASDISTEWLIKMLYLQRREAEVLRKQLQSLNRLSDNPQDVLPKNYYLP